MLVALTGFGQEQNKEEAARAGFDAHLTKPADEAALAGIFAVSRVERYIRQSVFAIAPSRGVRLALRDNVDLPALEENHQLRIPVVG